MEIEPPMDMDVQLEIERLGPGDGERLRAVRLRALAEDPAAFATTLEEAAAWSAERWDRQLEELATFVATAGGRDVGLVRGALDDGSGDAGEDSGRVGWLISMWVAPEARRGGVGAALVEAVVAWARSRGLGRLLLDVGEQNAPAIALYRRMGFVPTGKVGTLPPPRQGVRELQMVRAL